MEGVGYFPYIIHDKICCLQERIPSNMSDLDREIETSPKKNEKGVTNYY